MQIKTGNQRNKGGFTIPELALVLVISGIIMIALMSSWKIAAEDLKVKRTRSSIENAKTILQSFVNTEQRYPCPARSDLFPTDEDYGKEDCVNVTSVGSGANEILIGNYPTRYFYVDADNPLGLWINVKTTEGQEKAKGSESMKLFESNFLDPYGHPFLYAVTKSLTTTAYKENPGAISVVDEYNRNTAGTKGDAYYVIVSRGSDNRCSGSGISDAEKENCDDDDTFSLALFNGSAGSSHYDDFLTYGTASFSNMWDEQTPSTHTPVGDIKNNNITGNIGIGTNTPLEKVEVVGTTRSKGSVKSKEICEGDTSTCLKPETLSNLSSCSSGCSCPDKQYITRVYLDGSTLKVTCSDLKFLPSSTTCPSGKVLRAIYSNGDIYCVNP